MECGDCDTWYFALTLLNPGVQHGFWVLHAPRIGNKLQLGATPHVPLLVTSTALAAVLRSLAEEQSPAGRWRALGRAWHRWDTAQWHKLAVSVSVYHFVATGSQGMAAFNTYIPEPLMVLKLDLIMALWMLLKLHWNLFLIRCDGSPLLTHASSGMCGLCRCVLFCNLCVRLSQITVLLKGVWTFSFLDFNGF